MKSLTPAEALEAYVAAWNATDGDARSAHLLDACAADVVLLDPHAHRPVQGWGAVAAHIGVFRERYPHLLQPTSAIDAHHGVCRFAWRLASGGPGEAPHVLSTGIVVAEAAADGRLKRVLHFVDPTPAEAAAPEAAPSPDAPSPG